MNKTYSPAEHDRINAREYPGTRQLCSECDEPTGNCEDDSISIDDSGPLCGECYYELKDDKFKLWSAELAKIAQEKYNYKCDPIEDCGAESWRDYFDMDYSPEDALVQDMSYAK